jgi:tetratricopeptide (TPR) repeat protein
MKKSARKEIIAKGINFQVAFGDEPLPIPTNDKDRKKLEPLLSEAAQVLRGALLLEAEPVGSDSAFEAQESFFSALDAKRDDTIIKRLIKAVRTDPNNPDALSSLLGWVMPKATPEEKLPILQGILKAAKRHLGGEKVFKECEGVFWGVIETRPYMRAHHAYAKALYDAGQLEQAGLEMRAMLELNPNDNQGIRYELLPVYLEQPELLAAKKLVLQYKEEGSAMWAWGKLLLALLQDDQKTAQKLLLEARDTNPHAEKYLNGNKKFIALPETYGFGDENEAIVCAYHLARAWELHKTAQRWLWEQ